MENTDIDYKTLEMFKKHEIYDNGMTIEEFLVSYRNFQSIRKSHEWTELHKIARILKAEFDKHLENLGFDLPESELRRIIESLKIKVESFNREKNITKFRQATCYMDEGSYTMFVNENETKYRQTIEHLL